MPNAKSSTVVFDESVTSSVTHSHGGYPAPSGGWEPAAAVPIDEELVLSYKPPRKVAHPFVLHDLPQSGSSTPYTKVLLSGLGLRIN